MKRWLGILLALLLAFGSCAYAETELGDMQVVNCSEWVSLRESPDPSSSRLMQVPLGAMVSDCVQSTNGFIECSYSGMRGYILSEYLASTASVPVGLGDMQIANCDAWVSLRESPNTSSSRLMQVPLGAVVTDCMQAANGFIECSYSDVRGYILAEYLNPADGGSAGITYASLMGFGREVCRVQAGEYTVVARSSFSDIEVLKVAVFDSEMNTVWDYTTSTYASLMLSLVDAFVAGTEEEPLVIVYNGHQDEINAASGALVERMQAPESTAAWSDPVMNIPVEESPVPQALTAFDLKTGKIVWSLSDAETGLNGGLVYAVSEDGMLYIGGYLGPDPICISPDGTILCKTSADDDSVFWLYEISLEKNGIVALYESGSDGEMSTYNHYKVFYPMGNAFDPIWPTDTDAECMRISTIFYYLTRVPRNHSCQGSNFNALDIAVKWKNVYAVEDGVVDISVCSDKSGFGNYIRIKHTVYDEEGKEHYLYSLYAHLENRNGADGEEIKVGDEVNKGDLIGLSGDSTTGGAHSGAYHLHFELFESDANATDTKSNIDNLWHVYSHMDLEFDYTCVDSNKDFVASQPACREFIDYIEAHYSYNGTKWVRNENDDAEPHSSFIDEFYKTPTAKDTEIIEEIITPAWIRVVIED